MFKKSLSFFSVRFALWISITLLMCSCSPKEYDMDFKLSTDPAILEYFDRFETEALKFGLEIQLERKDIYGVFSDLDENKIGNCRYRQDEPRVVTVDRENWQYISDLEREYIIFHELGHCYLERGHDNSSDSSGVCLSIMHSAENKCTLIYNEYTRHTYLEELFTL